MTDLRSQARALFSVACDAADPALALRASLCESPLPDLRAGGVYIVVSVGKAAVPMARELLRQLAGEPVRALVVTNYENACDLDGAKVMASGHPVPDENGARAARAVLNMLDEATEKDCVVALISGGGSAMLPAPVEGLTLEDKAAVNRLLLANGFEITEINLVRQQLSDLKGGGMLRHAAPACVQAYILSDVIGDDLRVIASGPTVSPIGNRSDARNLLRTRGIWPKLPEAVRDHLDRLQQPDSASSSAANHLIGSNRKSLEAVALASQNSKAEIISDHLIGDVAEAADTVIRSAQNTDKNVASCLIFGGETTVTLKGNGLGGRNQELALRVALSMPDLGREWVFLSGGTDGRDGPTDAAGGIVDAGTIVRMKQAGVDPGALLENNDSYAALKASGDLLMTGATGTNVADVQILLINAESRTS